MRASLYFFLVSSGILFLQSCNNATQRKSIKSTQQTAATAQSPESVNESGRLQLRLNLTPGSHYYYNIHNESETELEAGGKTITNKSRSDVGLLYDIQKDSAGNYVLHMRYDKIQLYTKAGDQETERDAANAFATLDPIERMLGFLKAAKITATISPQGKIIGVTGYHELGDKIVASLNTDDPKAQELAQVQWEKFIGEGMVRRNLDQLVSFLPTGNLKVGDTWDMHSKQTGELPFNITSQYTLKDIDEDVAFIRSEGKMASDTKEANIMGFPLTGNLEGTQKGEFQVEAGTGMLLKNKVTTTVEGSLQLAGKEIPITITTALRTSGIKIK